MVQRTPPRDREKKRETACPRDTGGVPSKSNGAANKKDFSLTYNLDNKNIEICKECNRVVKDSEKGVQCDLCAEWFHAKCSQISSDMYKIISENEAIDWLSLIHI